MIAVIIDGGLVQEVICDEPNQLDMIKGELLVVDLDQEGREPSELIKWKGREEANVRLVEVQFVDDNLKTYLHEAQVNDAMADLQRHKLSDGKPLCMTTDTEGQWVDAEDVRKVIGKLVP